jgi:hypothetical protein
MTTYLFILLAFIALCAFWAGFQIWLGKQDPELAKRALKCGNCGCDKQCESDRTEPTEVS